MAPLVLVLEIGRRESRTTTTRRPSGMGVSRMIGMDDWDG
jgi:hypothetical protein